MDDGSRPSNLVAGVRRRRARLWAGQSQEAIYHDVEALCDEIERLTFAEKNVMRAYQAKADEAERLTAAKAEQVALKNVFRKQIEVVEAERDQLRAELEEARKPRLPVEPSPLPLVRELMAERDKLSEANMSLQRFSHEEISRLRMALQHYGQHDNDCSINVPYSPPRGFHRRPCGCGFSEALAGAAEPDKLETVQQNKLNAALNIGQNIGHAKRTADETSRCPHGKSWCFGPEAAENERRCLYCAGGSTGAA